MKNLLLISCLLLCNQTWALQLKKTAAIDIQTKSYVYVLALPSGLSTYVFDPDLNSPQPLCNQVCAEKWPPVLLTPEDVASLQAPYGSLTRASGLNQLTLNGRPVYTFFADRVEGDIKGDGLGGVWHANRVNP